jgi:hypothetical protein
MRRQRSGRTHERLQVTSLRGFLRRFNHGADGITTVSER